MPHYDYKCSQCSNTFEVFHSIMEDPVLQCPSCNSDSVKRLIGKNVGIAFKGSGFYITDSSKTSEQKSKSK